MDALEELQVIEGTSADTRITRLQDAWAAVQAQVEAGTLEADQQRSLVLTQGDEAGLSTRQIAQAIRVQQVYVVHLLRYHRFLKNQWVIAIAITVPESRFRAYWKEHSDPRFRAKNKTERDEYEDSIFRYIAKLIQDGIQPHKHPRSIKPVTNADIRKKADPIAAYRKEVQRRRKEVFDPFAAELKKLIGCDRSTYAPSILGGMGYRFEKIIDGFMDLLAPVNE